MTVFLRKYSIFAIITALVTLIPFYIISAKGLFPGILLNFFLFFSLVLLSVMIIIRSFKNKRKLFFPYFAYTIAMKMIVGLIYFILIFRHYDKNLTIFVFSFFLYYLIFSIFEVSFIVRQLKGQQQESESENN
jgi:hypothetical protein